MILTIMRYTNLANPTVQKNFRLPYKLVKKLEEYCRQNDVKEVHVVIEAIEFYFKAR